MTADAIVTLLVGVFGGGTVAAGIRAVASWRRGIRDADVSRDQFLFNEMRETLASHKSDIAELKEGRETDRERLDSLAEENRLYRWTLVGVTDRLRQMPPLTASDILDYIHERLPMLRKDK